jgi:hypothetical protein
VRKIIVFPVVESFSYCNSERYVKRKKYLKKLLVSNEKGCTFAPAFGRREGLRRREKGSVKVL